MNWVDIVLVLVVLLGIVAGWYRGFIRGSLDLLSWAASFILAYTFYSYTAIALDSFLNIGVWLMPLAFLITALLARILFSFLSSLVTRSIPDRTNHTPVNRFLGIIPGAINGWIAAVVISALLLALPLKDSITEATRDSRFAGRLAMQSEWANRKLAPVFDDAIKQTINSLTVKPESTDQVSLPFKYDSPEARADLEAKMLELVNRERVSRGLNALVADPELVPVARAHSKDMFARGYFAHISPEGTDPFDRMEKANVHFRAAGENLALAQTVEMAHTNLMNSPGHKANILNKNYGRVGIGILDGGYYGLMISQEFRN